MTAVTPQRIALIGGGKMGEAIMGGLIKSCEGLGKEISSDTFFVIEPNEDRRKYLEATYKVACFSEVKELPHVCDAVVLAVKPQVMKAVLDDVRQAYKSCVAEELPLFVSIAAGLPTATIESSLPEGSRVMRTMPNTPLLVSQGVVAITKGLWAQGQDVELVEALFDCLGSTYVVEESSIDAVGALSGSGPAYVAAFIEALRDGAVDQGLDFEMAESLAFETVLGTALLIRDCNQGIAETREAVCSPQGTTLAALAAFEEAGFKEACQAGVAAAVKRSKELSAC